MSAHPRLAYAAKTLSMAILRAVVIAMIAIVPFPSSHNSGLCTHAWAKSARRGKNKKAPKDFEYTVSDCLPAETLGSIRLEVSEGSLAFKQVLTMNCIAATRPKTVKLTYSKKGTELEVSIILRSEVLSDCTCPIGIEGTISNLRKGSHRITFVFDHETSNAADEKPVRQILSTQEVSLP
jgi:hypothetical protein